MFSCPIFHQVDTCQWDPIHLSTRDPGISHLFFVDDNTLMARVNEKLCNSIKNNISLFCKLLGQSINLQKFKILFSKNCQPNITKDVASRFNINISQTFGKYLGFLILDKNPKPTYYQFIIDNMRSRLTFWKANFLNIAGRTNLAISILNSIPNHAMLCNTLIF